jgi:hypothetical protein
LDNIPAICFNKRTEDRRLNPALSVIRKNGSRLPETEKDEEPTRTTKTTDQTL